MKSPFFAILAAGAVACVLVEAAAIAEPEKMDAPGIMNFSRIDAEPSFGGPLAGFGGATKVEAMPWLRSNGFATVISLRFANEEGADVESSRAAAKAVGLNYINLPFDPASTGPDVVETFLATVSDKANQPVYIHCNSATRVAALWMIGRVLVDGWTMDAASHEAEAIALKPSDSIAFATKYIESRGQTPRDR